MKRLDNECNSKRTQAHTHAHTHTHRAASTAASLATVSHNCAHLHNTHNTKTHRKLSKIDSACEWPPLALTACINTLRKSPPKTAKELVEALVAVSDAAGNGKRRIVIFVCVPHGCGKLTEARRHAEVAGSKVIPHTFMWGGFVPPADAAADASWVCLGRAAAEKADACGRRCTHEDFMSTAIAALNEHLKKNTTTVVSFIMRVGRRDERMRLIECAAAAADAVGIVYQTNTDRITAALAGAVGNVRQGFFPGVDATLRDFDAFQMWTASEIKKVRLRISPLRPPPRAAGTAATSVGDVRGRYVLSADVSACRSAAVAAPPSPCCLAPFASFCSHSCKIAFPNVLAAPYKIGARRSAFRLEAALLAAVDDQADKAVGVAAVERIANGFRVHVRPDPGRFRSTMPPKVICTIPSTVDDAVEVRN
jgi:hypothetical protein